MANDMGYPDNWSQLTPAQKREYRINRFLNPDIEFVSPQAAEAYKIRAKRYVDAFNIRTRPGAPQPPRGQPPPDYGRCQHARSNVRHREGDQGMQRV